MDKDYLLDLMVNVRERMIPVDEAVETICALADAETGEKQCNLPVVVCSNCPKVIGLTVGKSYTQLARHKDIIAIVNDYGDMKRYNIAYFE